MESSGTEIVTLLEYTPHIKPLATTRMDQRIATGELSSSAIITLPIITVSQKPKIEFLVTSQRGG